MPGFYLVVKRFKEKSKIKVSKRRKMPGDLIFPRPAVISIPFGRMWELLASLTRHLGPSAQTPPRQTMEMRKGRWGGGGAGVRGATRASVVSLPFLNGSQAQEPAAHWGAFTRHLCSSPSSAGSIFEPEAVFLGGGVKEQRKTSVWSVF